MPGFPNLAVIDFWVFFQVLVRVSSLIAVAPVFGSQQVPAQVKTGLALILSLSMTPVAMRTMSAEGIPTSMYGFASILITQVAVGLLMGFIVSLIMMAVQMAGTLLDLQIGFSMAQTFNPAIGELAAPVAQFQSMYALMLFLLAKGHYILLAALSNSFATLPASAVNMFGTNGMQMFTDATFNMLVNSIKIAAPAAGVLLVMDVSFALLSRAMPQMNIFYVGMPLKALAGVGLIALILPLFAIFVGHMVSDMPVDLGNTMRGIHR